MKYEINGFTHADKGERGLCIEHLVPADPGQKFRTSISCVSLDHYGSLYLTFPGTLEQKLKRVIGFRLAQEDGQLYMVADYLNPNRFRRTVKLGLIGGRGKIFTQVCDEIDFLNAALEDIFAEHRHMEEQEKQILMFA